MHEGRELDGRVAVITDSSRNIGKAIAEELANAGARVVVNARHSEAQARETARTIEATGGSAMVIADVTDAVEHMLDSVLAAWGRIDVLVNNANVHGVKPFEELTFDEWRRTMNIALDGGLRGGAV